MGFAKGRKKGYGYGRKRKVFPVFGIKRMLYGTNSLFQRRTRGIFLLLQHKPFLC